MGRRMRPLLKQIMRRRMDQIIAETRDRRLQCRRQAPLAEI